MHQQRKEEKYLPVLILLGSSCFLYHHSLKTKERRNQMRIGIYATYMQTILKIYLHKYNCFSLKYRGRQCFITPAIFTV